MSYTTMQININIDFKEPTDLIVPINISDNVFDGFELLTQFVLLQSNEGKIVMIVD